MPNWPEILLIDKPKGITSFDVIRRLRRAYSDAHEGEKAPKLGHSGTLDPLATGLMVLGCGKGTKKLADLIKLDKEYVAEVLIGESRTTGDMEGEIMEKKDVNESLEVLEEKIATELATLVGETELPVSAYSAIKVDGVPMYKRARRAEKTGEVVEEVPTRVMKVHQAELLSLSMAEGKVVAEVRFFVGSGTYIRSLGVELGKLIGYPACLHNLRRTKVGEFDIKEAKQIEEVFM